jgi:hypothetical protein
VAFSQPSSVVLGLPVDLASLASPLAIDKGGAIKSSGLVHSQQWLVGFGPSDYFFPLPPPWIGLWFALRMLVL